MKVFTLKNVRCNWLALSAPKSTVQKGKPSKPEDMKYSITLYLDKKADKDQHAGLVKFIKESVAECGSLSEATKKKIINEILVHVNGEMLNKFAKIKDGDALNNALLEEGKTPLPEQAGKWVVTLRNKRAPQVVDQSKNEVMGVQIDSLIRSGYWVNVALSAYAWSSATGTGAAVNLQGVQLVRKDTEFGRVDCGFGEVETSDEETENGTFED